MRMSECEILEGIQRLLGPGGVHWGKHAFYRTVGGNVKYCLLGAYGAVTGRDATSLAVKIELPITLRLIRETHAGVTSFNDDADTTWGTVNKLLNRAKKEACDGQETG